MLTVADIALMSICIGLAGLGVGICCIKLVVAVCRLLRRAS